jgi:hypothetical protein
LKKKEIEDQIIRIYLLLSAISEEHDEEDKRKVR